MCLDSVFPLFFLCFRQGICSHHLSCVFSILYLAFHSLRRHPKEFWSRLWYSIACSTPKCVLKQRRESARNFSSTSSHLPFHCLFFFVLLASSSSWWSHMHFLWLFISIFCTLHASQVFKRVKRLFSHCHFSFRSPFLLSQNLIPFIEWRECLL